MIFCEIIFKIKKGKLKWEDGDIGKRRKWGDKGVRACKLFSAKGNGRVYFVLVKVFRNNC